MDCVFFLFSFLVSSVAMDCFIDDYFTHTNIIGYMDVSHHRFQKLDLNLFKIHLMTSHVHMRINNSQI